jgi:propanol-preferring alcohol dehydrogenase
MDVGESKKEYCKGLGAEYFVDALNPGANKEIDTLTDGGSHGVLCLAPTISAIETSIDVCRRGGTVVLIGLCEKNFDFPVINVILKGITVRGSIVGTRRDMQEAFEMAARGLVKCDVEIRSLDEINDIIVRLKEGKVLGRMVVQLIEESNNA